MDLWYDPARVSLAPHRQPEQLLSLHTLPSPCPCVLPGHQLVCPCPVLRASMSSACPGCRALPGSQPAWAPPLYDCGSDRRVSQPQSPPPYVPGHSLRVAAVIRMKSGVQNTFCPWAQDRGGACSKCVCGRGDCVGGLILLASQGRASSQKEGDSILELGTSESLTPQRESQAPRENTHKASALESPHQRRGRLARALSPVTERTGVGWAVVETEGSPYPALERQE